MNVPSQDTWDRRRAFHLSSIQHDVDRHTPRNDINFWLVFGKIQGYYLSGLFTVEEYENLTFDLRKKDGRES